LYNSTELSNHRTLKAFKLKGGVKMAGKLTKQDIINGIAEKTGMTKKDSGTALDATLEIISDALAKGDSVGLIGFGTFEVRDRKARSGRNPQTGEPIEIPAKKVPAFKPGKQLREAVEKLA
jgi:DNA-binding protein HU-beta